MAETDVDIDRVTAWAQPWIGDPVAVASMTGGWTSTMLRLIGTEGRAVARLMTREPWRSHGSALTTREHQVQQMLRDTNVPAPLSIALDHAGARCGFAAHLMSELPGVVQEDRSDDGSLELLAEALASIHAVRPTVPIREYESWAWDAKFVVPDWSSDPALWHSAFDLLRQDAPFAARSFLHRDFQPRNILWSRGRITGVVDWVEASIGPKWLDVAHCSTHLAMHHGSVVAQRFSAIYSDSTGVRPEPYFDVMDIVGNLPAPGRPPLITDPVRLGRLEARLGAVLSAF